MHMEVPAQAIDKATARSPGTGWVVAASVLALVAVVYSQTWHELWPLWMDTSKTTYTHGLLVALVSVWLVWRKRGELQFVPLQPQPWAVPLVLAASLAWMIVAKAGILTLHAVLWPVLAWICLLAACGWRTASVMAFPLAYLWFAVPIWDHLNRALQSGTVMAVDLMTRATGVAAQVHGDTVTIPSGQFEIASGCSGLHFFMVALAVGALAGELHRDRLRTRLMLLALAAVLALVTNWLRVYLIILAGYLTDMQHYLVRVDHYKFGWVVFAFAMLAFFLFVRRLPVEHATEPAPPIEAKDRRPVPGLLAAVVSAVLLPFASWAATTGRDVPSRAPFAPPAIKGYTGPVSPSPAWRPRYRGPDAELRVAYVTPVGRVVDYYANRYFEQSQSGELIGYSNRLVDGAALSEIQRSDFVTSFDGRQLRMSRVDAASASGEDWVLLAHYYVGDRHMVGEMATQLQIGLQAMLRRVPSGIRAAAAPCRGDCDGAAQDVAAFLAQVGEVRR